MPTCKLKSYFTALCGYALENFIIVLYFRLTPHVRVVRLPETQLRSLNYEPYEFIYEGRQISESSEWNDMIQFLLRKAERFMKSNAFEVQIPEDITEGGRYSPRFIDEITDELDIIEDKSAPLFSKFDIIITFIVAFQFRSLACFETYDGLSHLHI